MRSWIVRFGLTLGLGAAAACGDDAAQTPPDPDGGVPDAGEPGPPVEIERRWLREGFGEPIAIGVGDLDGDNSEDIVLGGRGIALIDANARATHHPKWSVDWAPDPANVLAGGDNEWVHAMSLYDMTGDGVQDVLATTSGKDGYLVDGANGSVVWRRRFDVDLTPSRLATFSADDDGLPDLFPTGGRSAYSGSTGATLWTADIPSYAVFAQHAKLSGNFGQELLVTTEIDHGVGGAPPTPGTRDAVFALADDGSILWSYDVDGAPTALAAADLDGDLRDDAIVATWQGTLYALSSNGALLFRTDLGGFPSAIHVADADFSGAPSIFVGVSGANEVEPWTVRAIDETGALQWTQAVGGRVTALVAEQIDDDFELELLVGAGTHESPPGRALALDTGADATTRIVWSIETGLQVASFARAWIDNAPVLLVGGYDGVLRAVQPATGALAWTYTSGGFVFHVDAGDLDGDGADEIASGDDRGNLMVSAPADGSERWARRLDVGWGGAVTGTIVRDLEGTNGTAEVIATGVRYGQAKWGVLHIWEGNGASRATVLLDDQPTGLDAADLDGDGDLEIVVATRATTSECKVTAFDRTGTQRWSTSVASCEVATIAAADLDGDGAAEIAYGDVTLASPPHVALLGGDGAIRWNHVTPDDSLWVEATDGGVVHGGFSTGASGHVTRRAAADGVVTWKATLAGEPDPEATDLSISGGSYFGTLVPDLTGDGTREIAVTSETTAVTLLDGATGEARWSKRLEAAGLGRLVRRIGGPITYVPATTSKPAFLAAGLSNTLRSRSALYSISLDGAVSPPIATEGEAHAVAVARLAPDVVGAAFGAGLGVYTVAAK